MADERRKCESCGAEYTLRCASYHPELCPRCRKRQRSRDFLKGSYVPRPHERRICSQCGREYESRGAAFRPDLCGECRNEAYLRHIRKNGDPERRICDLCGGEYVVTFRARKNSELCPGCRKRVYEREYYEQHVKPARHKARRCRICGGEAGPWQKVCAECREKLKPQEKPAENGVCRICGLEYPVLRGNTPEGICPQCRIRERQREYTARQGRSVKERPMSGELHTCEVCGQKYYSIRRTRREICSRCQQREHYRKWRMKHREAGNGEKRNLQ